MKENFEKLLFANGFVTIKNKEVTTINCTLKPTPFPYHLFQKAVEKQKIMNKLFYNNMDDSEQISNCKMYQLLRRIRNYTPRKRIEIILTRTDYLIDDASIKQVEINATSCCFIIQGPELNRIHSLFYNNVLISDADQHFIQGLLEVQKLFIRIHGDCPLRCAIMVDESTGMDCSNIYEKIKIIDLCKKNNIDLIHMTYEDIRQKCKFVKKDGNELGIDEFFDLLKGDEKINCKYDMFYNDKKVFFIYYRYFYNYVQYTEEDIITRIKIECSSAISLPNVHAQIVGLKMFQVKWRDMNYLKKFLDQNEILKIYPHFGEFEELDNVTDKDEIKENWILKSMEEGGGHNYFGNDILNFDGDPSAMFLMKKYKSKPYKNAFIDDKIVRDVISEVGIMGLMIVYDKVILEDKYAGYICRTKDVNSNECGICCGFGALDSIYYKSNDKDDKEEK